MTHDIIVITYAEKKQAMLSGLSICSSACQRHYKITVTEKQRVAHKPTTSNLVTLRIGIRVQVSRIWILARKLLQDTFNSCIRYYIAFARWQN